MHPDAAVRGPAVPRVRLRYWMMGALLGLGLALAFPRVRASWRLHSLATSFANYGLCMIGPTGPTLLRDTPSEFWKLVRRRLLQSDADSRPFLACAAAAEELMEDASVGRAHSARAREFVEFGADAADRRSSGHRSEIRIADLKVTTEPLKLLAGRARPFLSEGYSKLVKPSLNAREAAHPSELPLPKIGSGLPAWRSVYRAVHRIEPGRYLAALGFEEKLSAFQSNDHGLTWETASIHDPRVGAMAGRCFSDDPRSAFSVGLNEKMDRLKVASLLDQSVVHTAELPAGQTRVIAIACDSSGLVAALGKRSLSRTPPDRREVELYLCPYSASCRAMLTPSLGQGLPLLAPLDMARVRGATVIATTRHGVVRTASTRDEGSSWTPFIVAFDREAYPHLRAQIAVPSRLLVLDRRVLLYAGSPKPSMTYPVLASDDLGASWRTPTPPASDEPSRVSHAR